MHLVLNKGTMNEQEMASKLNHVVKENFLPMDLNVPSVILFDDSRMKMRKQTFGGMDQVANAIQQAFDCCRIFKGCLVIFDEDTAYTYLCFTSMPIEEPEVDLIIEDFSRTMREYYQRMNDTYGTTEI